MVVLPAIAMVLLWIVLTQYRNALGLANLSVRGTFVATHIAFQAILALITEFISLGHHFTSTFLIGAWLLVILFLGGLLLVRWLPQANGTQRVRETLRRTRHHVVSASIETRVMVAGIVGVLLVLVVIGWLYAPANGDSLVYHLPRVAHWIQERSVAHFATHYLAQVEFSPQHEFNMLHLHVLFGSDRLDGYPQLLGFIGCIVGASEVARLLGAQVRTQVLAAAVCAVIPSAILEATSTQNNIFAASIAVGLVVLLLAWRTDGPWVGRSILVGLAGGLALLSKGTLVALIGPALLLLGLQVMITAWRNPRRLSALRTLLGAACAHPAHGGRPCSAVRPSQL